MSEELRGLQRMAEMWESRGVVLSPAQISQLASMAASYSRAEMQDFCDNYRDLLKSAEYGLISINSSGEGGYEVDKLKERFTEYRAIFEQIVRVSNP